MVGDLEDVDGRQGRGGAQQRLLSGWFEVSGEQQGHSRGAHQKGDAGVVGALGSGGGHGGRGGPEDLPAHRPGPAPLPRCRLDHRDTVSGGLDAYELGLVPRFLEPRRLNRADRAAAQDTGQPRDVIRVEVSEQQEWDARDTERAQAAVDENRVRARVDDHRGARAGREDGGIALPDVTHREAPAGRRPAGHHAGQRDRAEHYEEQEQGAGQGSQTVPEESAAEQDDDHGDDRQQERAPPTSRPVHPGPRQSGAGAGDVGDPPRGPTGAPGQRLTGRQRQRCHGQGREAEHRGRRHRELGEQVAGHRHQTDPGGQHSDDGSADGLGSGGRGERLGEPGRHPAALQGLAPARGEGEQGAGGEDGEQEAVTAGQPGVVQHQDQDRGGQGRDQ